MTMMTCRGKKQNPKALDAAIKKIEKKYGKGSIMRFGDGVLDAGPCVSTGSVSLDCALGGWGLPYGRIVEIYGPESSGKTTLALHIIANAQKKKGIAAIVDAEHALDPKYAKRLGVNLDDLIISQPSYGEQALGIVRHLIISRGVNVIVVDSVAALVPKAELDGEMDQETIGLQARLMGKALRKIVGLADDNNVLVVFINQERDKIGGGWGGTTTPGGKALKFWASVRIRIMRIKSEKENDKFVSNFTHAKITKSKICPPFSIAKFFITFGKGIDKAKEIFFWARDGKIIKRSGSIFKFKGLEVKGKKKFIKRIKKDKKRKRKLIALTKEYIVGQI